ncbi:hypothetical protein ASD54_23115 [Rhizobium sp. Root149]|uniref:DUF4214 domain-containing protein n=1 Tax=Rhizobium sp. Root149 TaxID=1736473 RepID=UPI000713CD4F|nr:DUF4214 domain-containing protein [Rhizobium sp. Root149]KQZ60483.1 hypothetical protein ASD54_23115 [Rhizobium sp. Root149]
MATIQGVYVALFGRPADPTGLAYFNSVTNNGANLNAIGNLATQSEYTARFSGLNNVQIINTIYQSLFGRDADLTGLTFFADALAKGTLNINNIAIAILDGAQGTDKTIVTNKVAAADLYTKALDTGAEVVAYSGLSAAAAGRTFLTGVTTTVPTAAAVDTAVAAMVTTSTGGGTGTTGVILTLTAGADTFTTTATADSSKTTAGNDTIRGLTAGHINAADVIDGGAGTDTLNALAALDATVKPVFTSVENVNLTYGTLTAAAGFDATDSNGILKLSGIDVKIDAAANTLTFAGVNKSTTVELKNITSDNGAGTAIQGEAIVNFKDVAGSNDSATVSLAKVTLGAADTLKLSVAGIENLTLNSTGATGETNTAVLNAAATSKLVITGDRDLTLDNTAAGTSVTALKTVDASAFTAKLTYTASANGETISGGTKGDAITLGGGADTLVYTAANASTLNNQDSITGFNAGTSTTAVDKINLAALSLGSDTTIGATNLSPAGDTAAFFSGTNRIVFNDTTKVLYVDVNKDGAFNAATDVAVTLTGVAAANLDKGDFILA